jgi:hypothetical protein
MVVVVLAVVVVVVWSLGREVPAKPQWLALATSDDAPKVRPTALYFARHGTVPRRSPLRSTLRSTLVAHWEREVGQAAASTLEQDRCRQAATLKTKSNRRANAAPSTSPRNDEPWHPSDEPTKDRHGHWSDSFFWTIKRHFGCAIMAHVKYFFVSTHFSLSLSLFLLVVES